MRLVLTIALLLIAGSARADEMTAEDLYSFCASNDRMVSNACRFYVLGVVQGVGIGDGSYMDAKSNQLIERKKTIFCIPDDMPQSQMIDLVRDMLGLDFKRYPEDKKLAAAGMVTGIMHTKFPCPR
jgi:Rap1a immunity proteins